MSETMKTLPLRELLRQPAKVKKLTAAGHPVRITDRGRPLWLIQPDRAESEKNPAQEDDDDDDAFWRELIEMPPLIGPSACQLLLESRR